MVERGSHQSGQQRRRAKGWQQWAYAFGPWAVGVAIVLLSVLVVAYENRYRGAVREEIETRLTARQEAAAMVAAHGLRDYLNDVVVKLQLVAQLLEASGIDAVPAGMLERVARHNLQSNYVTGIYVVDRDFESSRSPRFVFAIDDNMATGLADPERAARQAAQEYAEIVGHLQQYEAHAGTPAVISDTLTLNIGRKGQVLSVPIRGKDGRTDGLAAALLPTAFAIDQLERSTGVNEYKLWLLTADGLLLGGWSGPSPTNNDLLPALRPGEMATVETDKWVVTAAPVASAYGRPWTLIATQPRHEFARQVRESVGGPWTKSLLLELACLNFLGLCVLLTLRHWREQISVLRTQAEHDALTNAYSRRFLDREAAMLCRRVSKLGVLMIDLNDFKLHNDTLGHYVGDQMLKATADLLQRATREQDFVIRVGGDEFLLLLPMADDRLVALVESRIRDAVRAWNATSALPGVHLCFAVGGAAGQSRHLDYLIKKADERMYADKQIYKRKNPPPVVAATN